MATYKALTAFFLLHFINIIPYTGISPSPYNNLIANLKQNLSEFN